jgi:hypothetical protein
VPPHVHYSQMQPAPTGSPARPDSATAREREMEWKREGMDLPGPVACRGAPSLTTSVVVAGLCTYPLAVRVSHRWRRPPWTKRGARRRWRRPALRSRPRTHPAIVFARAALPAAATAASSRPRPSARAACHRHYRVQPPWALSTRSLLPPAPASRHFRRSAPLCVLERAREIGLEEEEERRQRIGERGLGSGLRRPRALRTTPTLSAHDAHPVYPRGHSPSFLPSLSI